MTPRLAPTSRAVAHAEAGVTRAKGKQRLAWNGWLDATENVRRAMEIYAEAVREARKAKEEEMP
jgi:hypothetical protein